MQQLYRIYKNSAKLWEKDPTDKEARLSATAAIDRIVRIASLLAADKQPEDDTPAKSDGLTMEDLLRSRG